MTSEFLKNLQPQIKKWRQELHQIPEIGYEEVKTAAYIRRELDKLGLPWQEICETGTIVYLDNQKESTLAFRSDIDALPIQEATGVDFASTHPGKMHACGHDGHMATLLSFGAWAKAHLSNINSNLLLIFQPAEETTGGAKDIAASGIFEKYHVKAIYGLHLMPDLPENTIGCRPGPLMAQTGEVHIKIQGKAAHAALAYQGIDSLYIASLLVQQYQAILTRRIPAMQTAVLHIGTLHSGEAGNIVASSATLSGTVRTFSRELFLEITDQMAKIHKGMEEIYGCTIDFIRDPGYPPVLNDPILTQNMVELLKENEISYQELPEPFFLGEDFSYYQEKVPGVFFFLGTGSEEKNFIHGLHHNQFNFDEAALLTGLKAFIAIAANKSI